MVSDNNLICDGDHPEYIPTPEDLKIRNNVIYLNIKPIYKNEIFIKQEKIFLALKESLGKKTPQDIR